MNRRSGRMTAVVVMVLGSLLARSSAWGCAACLGAPDSPLTQGLNMGIVSLLGVVSLVLGGVVVFFVHLARRAAALEAEENAETSSAILSEKVARS